MGRQEIENNMHLLGVDILFIMMWVGAWGIFEIFVDYFAKDNVKARFLAYFVLFLCAFLPLIWVSRSPSEDPQDD